MTAPVTSGTFSSRAVCRSAKGEWGKAIEDCDKAIHLDPDNILALHLRANIRITCPNAKYRDGKLAIKDATRLCELTKWDEPGYLPMLATAYAEAGQFDQAVKWQKKLVDSAKIPESEKGVLRQVLKLYEQKKTNREAEKQ